MSARDAGGLWLCPRGSCLLPGRVPGAAVCYAAGGRWSAAAAGWNPSLGNDTLTGFLAAGFHPGVCASG